MSDCGLESLGFDRASTNWLTYLMFDGRDYVDLIKMMLQTLPCWAQQFNINKQCRMGCTGQENVCHILQKCHRAHYPWVRHHNESVKLIIKSCKQRGYSVYVEPWFMMNLGLWKPDVLVVDESGENAYIIDHTVVWEAEDLVRHARSKFWIWKIVFSICTLALLMFDFTE